MGGVGSSAAVLLGTDLIGGSGLRGIDPMCFCWGKNRDEEREGELPVTPITLSSVIDIMSPGPSQDRAGGNNSIKKGGKALNSHNVDSKDADRTSTLPFVGLDGTSNAHNFWRTGSNELKPQISRSNSGTGESDVYQSADALLNHLYATGNCPTSYILSFVFIKSIIEFVFIFLYLKKKRFLVYHRQAIVVKAIHLQLSALLSWNSGAIVSPGHFCGLLRGVY